MSRRSPNVLRQLARAGTIQSALRAEQHKVADLERYNEQLGARLRNAQAEIERCRREHTGLAERNGRLQQSNCSLADRVWKAEQAAADAGDELVITARALVQTRSLLRRFLTAIAGEAHTSDAELDELLRDAGEVLLEEQT